MTDAERLQAALDIAYRLTTYGLYPSMKKLRAAIRVALRERGLEDQMCNFKLRVDPNDRTQVNVSVRAELAPYITADFEVKS